MAIAQEHREKGEEAIEPVKVEERSMEVPSSTTFEKNNEIPNNSPSGKIEGEFSLERKE